MKWNEIPLRKILFLDIETVPMAAGFDEIPENMQQLWQKKSERISPDANTDHAAAFFEKAGIYSEFGKIVCISAGFFYEDAEKHRKFRVKAFSSDDEKELLTQFAGLLTNHFNDPQSYLCGHNAREFDFPYIGRRLLVNQIPLPEILNLAGRKPWEVTLLDTMELWKFGDYKSYTSLALLAAIFDIPTPKDDIAGNDVARVYWCEQDLPRIATYCNKDVVTTARIFLKYRMEEGLIDEDVELLFTDNPE